LRTVTRETGEMGSIMGMPRIFPVMWLVVGVLEGAAPSQICFAGHLPSVERASGFGRARVGRALEHGCCSRRSTTSCAPPLGRMEGRSLSVARCSMSGKEPLAIRRDDPRLKIRDSPSPPLHMVPSCKDPGSRCATAISRIPSAFATAAGTRMSDLSGRMASAKKPMGATWNPSRSFLTIFLGCHHELVGLDFIVSVHHLTFCFHRYGLYPGIMEEVVRLASDPSLQYQSKQSTVAKVRRNQ